DHAAVSPPYLRCLALPTPFAVGPVNVYVAEGPDGLTLVDVGPRTRRTQAALLEGLEHLGYRLEQVRRILITHAHVDHYGLAAFVVREAGAEVWTHPWNVPTLADDPEAKARRDAFYTEVYRKAAVPEAVRQGIYAVYQGFRRFAEPVEVARTLDEGDQVSLGDETWQVLHLPGHSGGLIGLWQPDRRLLLSSDHLLRDITSNPLLEPPPREGAPRRQSLREYLNSLRQTSEMDVRLALPGHGDPITDVASLVRQRFAFHEERQAEVLAHIAAGTDTVYALCQALFRNLSLVDAFLAVSEVVGHLDLLAEAGHIRWETRDGVWRLRPARGG
ncbi:MAG: MBL fold metallo-hydrolase, partial [Anaerolineae bacterium]|nr:MBL fold metallo-hydrolase [Anaerolineae bacterium]